MSVDWPEARGFMLPGTARRTFRYARLAPAPELAPFVEHYWIVEYDLRGQPPYRQRILPHPSVNLTVWRGRAQLAGVLRAPFEETLSGAGRVLGTRFRAGGFRPFLGAPVARITDRFLTLPEAFGPAAAPAAIRLGAAVDAATGLAAPAANAPADAAVTDVAPADAALARALDEFLGSVAPPPDPGVAEAAGLVDVIRAERGILRVTDLADRAGIGVRRLQRIFAEYVGVGPKWVIRRYRLHEAAERAAAGGRIDWAGLAVELGYADQAHLVRDFTDQVGEPPARYAERCAGQRRGGPANTDFRQ